MRAERLPSDDASRSQEHIESAELQTLQREFAKLAEDPDITDVQKATVQSRIDVLEIKGDVQDRLARLKAMRERTRIDGDNINATRMAMDTRAPFDIVGQLNASVVFSGSNTMPQLFRLQDMAGGHTIAHVVPDKRYDMASWTGLSVGIIGSVEYDEALQLNVVRPRRIDLLAKQTAGTDHDRRRDPGVRHRRCPEGAGRRPTRWSWRQPRTTGPTDRSSSVGSRYTHGFPGALAQQSTALQGRGYRFEPGTLHDRPAPCVRRGCRDPGSGTRGTRSGTLVLPGAGPGGRIQPCAA